PDGPQRQAVGREPQKAQQGAVAQCLDADDEEADAAADDGAAENLLPALQGRGGIVGDLVPRSLVLRTRLLRGRRFGDDDPVGQEAEEDPTEQPAEGAEYRVEVDAREEGHVGTPERARAEGCLYGL